MTNIYIIGATGLLAGWIVPELRKMNSKTNIITVGRRECDRLCDLTDINDLEKSCTWQKSDWILNLSALANVDTCQNNIHEAYLANVKIPENLAKISKKYGCKVIHISTDHLYDSEGLKNEAQVNLRNVYALSKYAGELALQGCESVCLRTNFFGKSRTHKASFSDWVYQVFTEKQSPTFYDDIYVSFIHWSTLHAAILAIMQNFKSGIYNLGTQNEISKAQFAISAAKALGIYHSNYKIGFDPSENTVAHLRAPRAKNMAMDSSLFAKTFHFNLPTIAEEIEKLRKEYV